MFRLLFFLFFNPIIILTISEEENIDNDYYESINKPRSKIEIDFNPFGDDDLVDVGSSLQQFFGQAASIIDKLTSLERGRFNKPRLNKSKFNKKDEEEENEEKRENSFFDLFDEVDENIQDLKGPHICVKEINSKIDSNNSNNGTKCNRYQSSLICITINSGKMTHRIQDCCDGYTTTDIFKFGCNKEINEQLLLSYNISINDFPLNSTLLLSKNDDESFILPGIQNIYEWIDEQILKTDKGQQFIVRLNQTDQIKINLNCARNIETIKMEKLEILKFNGNLKPAANNILNIIEKHPNLSIFSKILDDELKQNLSKLEKSTIFAFTNEAFDEISDNLKNQILQKNENICIESLMKLHISSSESYCASDLPSHIKTQNGAILRVFKNASKIKIDEAEIVEESFFALNGVVHIINKVLFRENFLSWQNALQNYNNDFGKKLAKKMSGKNQSFLTIFVPPNDNSTEIPNLLDYVVSNRLISIFDSSESIITDSGSKIFIGSSNQKSNNLSLRLPINKFSSIKNYRIGCANLISESIHSCKSIIHFIDRKLKFTNQTIEQYLSKRTDLNKFYSLWSKSNISSTILNYPTTLFIPHDDAFSPNFFRKIQKNQKQVEEFVKRHIVKSILCQSDLIHNPKEIRSTVKTSMNGDILSSISDGNLTTINDIPIQESEIVLSNGVIYILESFIPKKYENPSISSIPLRRYPFDLFSHIIG